MAVVPEHLLECSICFQRLKDPRTLRCAHIFCQKCITDWLNKNDVCPLCRKKAALGDLKQLYVLNEILNNIRTDSRSICDACNDVVDELQECGHCSRNICAYCEAEHIKEVKAEVRKACDELVTVSLPGLEKQEEKIGILMSEAASAKSNLTTQLRKAHEALVDQIAALKLKSLDTLERILGVSPPGLNTQIEEAESLITRIEKCISESAEILEKKDLEKLFNLSNEVDCLQKDILYFRENKNNSDGDQMDSLRNLKINPAYKWIANVIAETEMVRKSSV